MGGGGGVNMQMRLPSSTERRWECLLTNFTYSRWTLLDKIIIIIIIIIIYQLHAGYLQLYA
jgi:hypothetical protein